MEKFYILLAFYIVIAGIAIVLNLLWLRRTDIRRELKVSRGAMKYGWRTAIIVDIAIKLFILYIVTQGIIPMYKDLGNLKDGNVVDVRGFVAENKRIFGRYPIIQYITINCGSGEEKIAVYFNENIVVGTAQRVKYLPNSRFAVIERDNKLEDKLKDITKDLRSGMNKSITIPRYRK
mgnify:CR=1 FL=1